MLCSAKLQLHRLRDMFAYTHKIICNLCKYYKTSNKLTKQHQYFNFQVLYSVFSAQQHIAYTPCLVCCMLSPVRLSVTWVNQSKMFQVGLWNFRHMVAPSL